MFESVVFVRRFVAQELVPDADTVVISLLVHCDQGKSRSAACGTIYFNHDYQINRYQAALAEYWKKNAARQHHALVDANSLLFAWKQAIKRGVG